MSIHTAIEPASFPCTHLSSAHLRFSAVRAPSAPMRPQLAWFVLLLSFAAGSALTASDEPRKGPPPPPPETRQFDFWIGTWEVTTPDGKVAGHNVIEPVLGGRALRETWTGAGGFSGTSLNTYDASARVWRQFWVDQSGGVLTLSGNFADGAMSMEQSITLDGLTTIDRITWTPHADGTVRQLWEQSKDARITWSVLFDGLYRRKP